MVWNVLGLFTLEMFIFVRGTSYRVGVREMLLSTFYCVLSTGGLRVTQVLKYITEVLRKRK